MPILHIAHNHSLFAQSTLGYRGEKHLFAKLFCLEGNLALGLKVFLDRPVYCDLAWGHKTIPSIVSGLTPFPRAPQKSATCDCSSPAIVGPFSNYRTFAKLQAFFHVAEYENYPLKTVVQTARRRDTDASLLRANALSVQATAAATSRPMQRPCIFGLGWKISERSTKDDSRLFDMHCRY